MLSTHSMFFCPSVYENHHTHRNTSMRSKSYMMLLHSLLPFRPSPAASNTPSSELHRRATYMYASMRQADKVASALLVSRVSLGQAWSTNLNYSDLSEWPRPTRGSSEPFVLLPSYMHIFYRTIQLRLLSRNAVWEISHEQKCTHCKNAAQLYMPRLSPTQYL